MWQNQQNRQQMDMVKDAFWDYVTKASTAVEESLKQIQASQLSSEMK